MFGLKIFVRVQTFRRVPPVLPCNFCHPALMHILWFCTLCLYTVMQLFLTSSCLPRFSFPAKFSKITNGLPWIVLSSIKALPEKLQREGLSKIFLSHPAIKRMTTFVWYIPFKNSYQSNNDDPWPHLIFQVVWLPFASMAKEKGTEIIICICWIANPNSITESKAINYERKQSNISSPAPHERVTQILSARKCLI